MEKHSKECEMNQLRQKLRQHEEKIGKLSEETQYYTNKMKKQFPEVENNPQKFNKYRQTMKEHEDMIKNLKQQTEKIKKHALEIQDHLNQRKTIKNYGLLGYAFIFIIKLIEQHTIDCTYEEIISFIVYMSVGSLILIIDWMTKGIDEYIFGYQSTPGYFFIVFVVNCVCFMMKWLCDQYLGKIHFRAFSMDNKNSYNPGWILNPIK